MLKNINIIKFHILIITISTLLFTSCSEESKEFAKFTFQENLAITYNTEVEISILPLVDGLQEIELEIGDSLVKKWVKPTKNELKHTINASKIGIGAKGITLTAKNGKGEIYKDERILRVLSDLVPEIWTYEIVDSYPHNINNFTQGFEFNDGQLYESTGQLGESKIAKINLKTGEDISKIGLDGTHFGEGITILGDTIYQLTWTTHKCFLYNKNTLELLKKDFTFQGEGWGLCNDGKHIIMSDGTERLTFRDPKTFAIVKTIEVYTHEQPIIRLNELEYVDGLIYANIWMSNTIAVIEPETGRVMGLINGDGIVAYGRGRIGEVFNGLAYNQNEKALYVTGKYWEKTIKIKLEN